MADDRNANKAKAAGRGATERRASPSKTSERRRKSRKALGDLTRGLLTPALRQKGFLETEVASRWADIVGQDIARGAVPLRLKFPPGQRMGATLMVRAIPAFAPVVSHRETQIIEAVNSFFGFGAVARVSISQGQFPVGVRLPRRTAPIKPSTLAADRRDIAQMVQTRDSALSNVLSELGLLVRARKGGGGKP